MLDEVMNSQKWLQSVIDDDPDINCQLKATHALGLIIGILKEELPLMVDSFNT
ncbi:hypothetical protein X975_23276, partial [Stegodyphus mimosarum]